MPELVAVLSLMLLAYTYAGYPCLLFARSRCKAPDDDSVSRPSLSVVVAAHNEEACIERTLRSVLDSEYPSGRLEVIVCSDASTDGTDEVVREIADTDTRVTLTRLSERAGKARAIERGCRSASAEIVVMIDASGTLESKALGELVQHFSSPTVGSVVGAKRITPGRSGVSQGDGLYWRYESTLRRLESDTGSSLVGVEGGFFAIRRRVLDLDFADDIAADYAICARVYEQGYRNLYEPRAVVWESASIGWVAEARRKVRVIVRGIRGFLVYRRLLNPLEHPAFALQNVSHRLLRWLAPFFLIAMVAASALGDSQAARALFATQALFYGLAAAGALGALLGVRGRVLSVPMYFTTMNIVALVAWFSLFRRFDVWERTVRDPGDPLSPVGRS